jgi:hypothetical protein
MEWEYYVHELHMGDLITPTTLTAPEATKMLNWYAAQGWEFVSNYATSYHEGRTYSVAFIFRRRKGSQPSA